MTRPRRVAALAAAPLAALAGILAVQLTGAGNQQPAAQVQAPEDDSAAASACKAEYASVRLPDGSFTARLAVTNIGGGDLRDWTVRFRLPQRQRVTEVAGARWSQHSRTVTLTAADLLPSGAKAAMTVRGTFDEQHDGVPGAFSVGGVPCMQAVTRVQTSSTPGPADTATAEDHSGGRGAAEETDDPGRSSPSSTAASAEASHTVTHAPTPSPPPSSGQSSGPVESSAPADPSGEPSSPDGGVSESPSAPQPSSSHDAPASSNPSEPGDGAEQPGPEATPRPTGPRPRAR